jgi:N-acetyl sugar amidotransferase
VMDTTDVEIVFNNEGCCNHCTEFLNRRAGHKYRGKESDDALESVIGQMKLAGKGKKYDCIVGISGGADSAYAIYVAKQKGLKILTVHLDNGWNSEEAVQNIKNVTRKLEVDYESYVLDWEEFKDIQLAFLKASVPEAETPTDIALVGALHYYANKYDVKYIISGGNLSTEGILPASWHYNAKDMKYFNYIQRRFGQKKMRKFPTFGYKKEIYYKLIKRTKIIYLLNYVSYVKEDVTKFLAEKLDWKALAGKHYESKYTSFIQSYYLFEKFNIDYRRATLSSQICSGDVERDAALKLLISKPYTIDKIENDKRYIAKKLQITSAEFESILNLPPKWYWDYPNDKNKLKFIYDTYRKLYKKEQLGSF